MNELINDESVCRTAPATPGLLNIQSNIVKKILDKLVIMGPNNISSVSAF